MLYVLNYIEDVEDFKDVSVQTNWVELLCFMDIFLILDFPDYHGPYVLAKFGYIFGLVWKKIVCDWLKKMFKQDSSLSKIEANMLNALLVNVPVLHMNPEVSQSCRHAVVHSGCTIH